jgi:predicted O-methyltransferase YrrM
MKRAALMAALFDVTPMKERFMTGNDFITEYIRSTMVQNEGILRELEQYAGEHRVPIVKPETARLLTVLGRLVKPERILEVGTAIGYSSMLLARTLSPGGRIDTIERQEDMLVKARENIKRAGLEHTISVIAGDAEEVLRCLDKQYDMVFLDAAKGQYPEFLPECLRMLKAGGLLVSDNVLFKGMVANDDLVIRRKKTIVNRMRTYLDMLCSDPNLETSILPVGDGVALTYKLS